MSPSNANLAHRIKRHCEVWFKHNPIDECPNGLLADLTVVEAHLVLQSVLDLTADVRTKQEAQQRPERIARIEGQIKMYPALERQLRVELNQLWESYTPTAPLDKS